jgi:hypothetical protein
MLSISSPMEVAFAPVLPLRLPMPSSAFSAMTELTPGSAPRHLPKWANPALLSMLLRRSSALLRLGLSALALPRETLVLKPSLRSRTSQHPVQTSG